MEDTANLARQGNEAESRAASAASAAKSASAASAAGAAAASKAAKATKADLAPPQVAKASLPAAGPSKAGANFAAASAAMERVARQLAVHGGGQAEDRASGGQSPQATDLSTTMP